MVVVVGGVGIKESVLLLGYSTNGRPKSKLGLELELRAGVRKRRRWPSENCESLCTNGRLPPRTTVARTGNNWPVKGGPYSGVGASGWPWDLVELMQEQRLQVNVGHSHRFAP